MIGDNGNADGNTEKNSDDHSPVTSSRDTAGSRFDAFLERFDSPESEEKKGTVGTESDTGKADADTDIDSWVWGTPNSTPDSTTDSNGWIWVDPHDRRGEERTLDSSETKTDPQTETQPEQPSKSDRRIWHRDFEAGLDMASPKTPESTQSEDKASISGGSKEGGKSDERADMRDRSESEERSDTIQQDRWSELGSGLRVDENAESEPATRRTETAESVRSVGEEQRTPEGETNGSSWDATDETTLSGGGQAEKPPSLDDGHSQELDRVIDDASVLSLGPIDHPVSDAICSRFLVGPAGTRDVLFVTFEDSPGDRIDVCNHADGWEGGKIGVVRIGRASRNAATTSETTTGQGSASITVRHVAKPGDLSKLGIVISQLLSEFEETPRETVVCFHTLSALHTQTGTKTLFRFLNTLQGRLRSSGAIGHYHMDPDLHDEIVIETLRPLFDSVVRYSADGELEIE